MLGLVFVGFLGSLVIGVPIGFAVLLGCVLVMVTGPSSLIVLGQKMVDNVGSFTMLAMPLFIFSGNLMAHGSTPRLMRLANLAFRRIPGGLGAAGIGACGFFGAVSGSGVATTAAVGSIVGPEMIEKGYKKGYVASILTAAGTLGGIIPPSITMVLFATAAGVSVGKSLLAGLVPGFFMIVLLIAFNTFICKRKGYGLNTEEPELAPSEKRKIMLDALAPLMMPVIVLGGVLTGIITPTESAVIATVYAAVLAVFVYRDLDFKGFVKVTVDSAVSSAGIMIIISAAGPFGYLLTVNNVATFLAAMISELTSSPVAISIIIIVFLVFLGTFMEGLSTVVLLTPILLPIVKSIGMDPIHFGVMFGLLTCVGAMSPPMAVCLFTSCRVLNTTVQETFPEILEVMAVFLLGIVILWCFPVITTFLPNMFFR